MLGCVSGIFPRRITSAFVIILSMQAFMKYFITSVLGLAVDYAAVLMALAAGISYEIALLMGLLVGGVLGFTLLTYWVFPTQKNALSWQRIASFLGGLALIYCIRTAWMYAWYKVSAGVLAQEWDYIALLGAYGASFMMNFLCQKFFYNKG